MQKSESVLIGRKYHHILRLRNMENKQRPLGERERQDTVTEGREKEQKYEQHVEGPLERDPHEFVFTQSVQTVSSFTAVFSSSDVQVTLSDLSLAAALQSGIAKKRIKEIERKAHGEPQIWA